MTGSSTRPTRRLHGKTVVLVSVALLSAAGSILAITASANLAGSTFEGNDGNLVVNTSGNTDWANVTGRHTGIDTPSGSSDNAFGQGTKEDNSAVSVVDGSIPPNKNDLTRFYEASQQAGNGHIYLYLGWERLVNIGNANLDFEINQTDMTSTSPAFTSATVGPYTLSRSPGDLLVTYDFGGSGTPTLGLNTWVTSANGSVSDCFSANALPCWGKHVVLNGTNSEGAVNTGTIAEPLAGGTLGAGLFGEASIDLTAAGVFQPGVCSAFGSTFLKSRSSSSFTAELKDFIAPTQVNISNCGTITINKVTENGDSSFGYTTTGSGLSSFSLSNGQQKAFSDLPAGSYSVTENLTSAQTTAGWTLKSLSCTPSGAVSVSGSTANITLPLGGNVVCTYTNHINNSPTISTTLSATTINKGGSVHDSAALTGATSNAGGTVDYHAYAGANTCTGTDLFSSISDTSTVTVTNGNVPDSPSLTFATPGYYSFQAVYSGDSNNNGATSVCSTEQLLVKATPSIGTTLSAAAIDVGGTVHDSATLTGATSDAGGTVTYHAFSGANNCTTGTDLFDGVTDRTVNVTNGSVPNSPTLTLNTAGAYSFQAVYSGDTKNNGATSVCSTEQLTVNPKQPDVSTAQSLIPNDSFALTGAFNATGTITFNLYGPLDTTCSSQPVLTETVSVSGNGIYKTSNTTFKATAEGTWRWESSYSGDGNNLPVESTCGTERFSIANS